LKLLEIIRNFLIFCPGFVKNASMAFAHNFVGLLCLEGMPFSDLEWSKIRSTFVQLQSLLELCSKLCSRPTLFYPIVESFSKYQNLGVGLINHSVSE